MKVTVCFGSTRVIVPCGRGEILVRDLIHQAITRYKKATGKSSNSWVTVHSLQSQSDGGILDPDDRLRDVADDREQIVALYDDGDSNSPHQHGGGDGASATSSPDMFHSRGDGLQTDIEVTNEQIACGFPALHVRRGSEPALNQLPLECPNNVGKRNSNTRPAASGQSKRWSAAPMIHDPKEKLRTDDYMKINGFGLSDKWRCSEEDEDELELGDEDKPPISNHFLAPSFNRDSSNRLSMQFLGESSSGFRWAEAADLANNRALSLSLPRDHRRKEPLGQANTNPSRLIESQNTEFIVLSTGGGSLGIHVVPDYNALGKERGLLVQGIEPGGRVHCDGRLKVYDRIVEINGRSLLDQPFNAIQEIFRDSLHSSELKLRVIKHKNNMDLQASQNTISGNKKQPPPPVFPKPSSNTTTTYNNKENVSTGSSDKDKFTSNTKIATVSPTKKISASTHTASNILMVANTRKIGKKMELELTKGLHGLGFSITTRDNPAGGNCPIYIKNVLPKGAAVEDGRLRPGDRLLAVNGTELTGKTQSEAVAILRKVPSGAKVKIIVSRQEDVVISQVGQKSNQDLEENHEREVGLSSDSQLVETNEKSNNNNTVQEYVKSLEETQTFPWRHKEILTFDIPVHDSEKAGLGISVKGKTSSSNNSNDKEFSQDLGIFIKNVIHGGAASRDGRLRTNDQLLYINGMSLIGQTNAAAMETLRRTMMNVDPGPVPGAISLIVARRRNSSPTLDRRRSRDSSSSLLTDSSANTETFSRAESSDSSTQNTAENSGTSENSDTTVIFMHQRQSSESSKRNTLPTDTSPDGIAIRNPVLERLTGHTNRYNALRNESYYKATHQTTIMLKEEEKLNSPTVNPSSEEMLIIEEDPPIYNSVSRKKIEEEKPSPIVTPQTRTGSTSTDVTYASQLSLDNANSGFSRDAFGRQSMSEKRHATLDAKNTDTYQRNKKLREERGDDTKSRNSFPSKHQLGPSLGLKKSSSLESLQTMVQEVQMTDGGSKRGNVKVVRGRGCDESFRAAVDKDGPLSLHELRLETYGKESDDHPIGRRQSSLHSPINYKAPNLPPAVAKKKPGLLKGIGSMFRFGKPRRGPDLNGTLSSEEDNSADREREIARRNARDEQLRIQEQYQRLIQRQAEMQEQNNCREVAIDDGTTTNYNNMPAKPSNPEQSRMDRIQQLRAEHQRRHMERSGKLIPDEREENHYESDVRPSIGNTQNAINRPGSRVGIIDSSRFNHYVNFQEIQQNLSRRQLHYHSQRRDPKESVARPSSNYYEYESVMRSLPYTTGGASRLVDNNSNSLTRQVDSVTQTAAVAAMNNNKNGVARSQKQQSLSRHHYPVPATKSPNYALYNYSGDAQGHNSVQQQQQQQPLHRGSANNNNYASVMYHQHQQQLQRSSPQQGPYITQVTIRDNKHIIQSPNI